MNKLTLLIFFISACSPHKEQASPPVAEVSSRNEIAATPKKQDRWKNKDLALTALADSLKLAPGDIKIVITKSAYALAVYRDTMLIKNYPVVFGPNPVDDKLRKGDGCTPEGTFNIRSKYPHKSWSKFIWIDYPSKDSWRKHNLAKEKGLIHKEAGIGGEIGIHGVPKGYDHAIDHRQNWTLGCISMKNKDVDDLYPMVSAETVVEIRK